MAASAMHVLELLRRAEAYPLSVKHVFEEFEGAGVHVGDLGNALRHLAWSLQRIWELRSAATDEVRQSILSDVQEVHRWIIQGVSMRRAEAAEARASFEKKVLELKNSGLCKEEIFGDSPLGDEMHVALEVVWVRKASVENWTAFELIARQYCASCGALCEAPGEPSYEAFVDIRYLPIYEGVRFPSFLVRMADAISGDIAFHFTVSGHTLTIRPGRGVAKVERQGRHVELYGGITEPIEDAALSEIPWGPGVELMVTYKGAEVLRGKTSVRVTAGRSVQVVGAVELDGPVHCPVIRIVKRSEVLQYGYAVGRFERLDAWVPRGLVWCLSS